MTSENEAEATSGAPKMRPTKMRRRTASRMLAIQFLYQLDLNKSGLTQSHSSQPTNDGEISAYLLRDLNDFADHYAGDILGALEVTAYDETHYQMLAANVITHLDDFNTQIEGALGEGWSLERLAHIDKTLLRTGLAELRYLVHVPAKAVLSEYAGLCDIYQGDVAFVNAVLDRLARSARKLELAD